MSERIDSLVVHPVALPFRRPYVTATGRIERREMAIVELRGSSGARGWGDAVPMSLRGGPGLDRLIADLESAREALVGAALPDSEPADVRRTIAGLLDPLRAAGSTAGGLAALEVALLDLAGRAAATPCWRLLGSKSAVPVECNGTLGADAPEEAAAAAHALTAAGFDSIKVKVGEGAGDVVTRDIERLRAVREAVGPDVALRVDANRAYSVTEALELIDGLGFDLELAEQPCGSLSELRAVREAATVPVVADESVEDVAQARAAVAAGACDAITVKLAKVGGPSTAIEIASVAPTYLSSALDSAIGVAAAVHTAQALGAPRAARSRAFPTGLAHGLATSAMFSDDVADVTERSAASLDPPEGQGLGVEVDEAALRRLRIEV